jgi:hypothetical protein
VVEFAEAAAASGVAVQLEVAPEMVHVFQLFAALAEGMSVINFHLEQAGRFLRAQSSAAASLVPALGRAHWVLGQTASELEPVARCAGWLLKESEHAMQLSRRWVVLIAGDCAAHDEDAAEQPPPASVHEAEARKQRAQSCGLCGIGFGMLTTRHHCHRCLRSVCDGCSPGKALCPAYHGSRRVCKTCEALPGAEMSHASMVRPTTAPASHGLCAHIECHRIFGNRSVEPEVHWAIIGRACGAAGGRRAPRWPRAPAGPFTRPRRCCHPCLLCTENH